MLEFYTRLAARLRPHAWLGWILVAGAAAAFPAAIFLVKGATGQFLGLAAIISKGFLDEDVFVVLKGSFGHFVVCRHRSGDSYGLGIRVQELLVVAGDFYSRV